MFTSLPMPNDRLPDGRTVIASCDQENGQYDLLVLNTDPGTLKQRHTYLNDRFDGPTQAGYYSVLVVVDSNLSVVHEDVYPNIIPATEAYSDAIGGY